MTILVIFCYFQGLETCLKSKEEMSNFNLLSTKSKFQDKFSKFTGLEDLTHY